MYYIQATNEYNEKFYVRLERGVYVLIKAYLEASYRTQFNSEDAKIVLEIATSMPAIKSAKIVKVR